MREREREKERERDVVAFLRLAILRCCCLHQYNLWAEAQQDNECESGQPDDTEWTVLWVCLKHCTTFGNTYLNGLLSF